MNISVYKLFSKRNIHMKHIVRLQHKISKENEGNDKLAPDVLNFLDQNPEYADIKDHIPQSLLRKYKTPESMYLINKGGAKHIAKAIKHYLKPKSPIVEVNPGFCFLTEELIKAQKEKIYLYENTNYFSNYITDFNNKHPNRVVTKMADFFKIWKYAFLDKMDQGSRVNELLMDLASEDPNRLIHIVGAMPGLAFMRYLLTTILFHNTTNLLGRPDLFMIMPGYQYEYLSDKQIQKCKHKHLPALFQLLFDYKILDKVPRLHYLPWIKDNKKNSLMDEHYMYLVNITRKEKLPCHPDYMPLLWYFFKPHIISNSTRVIPMLEQWIPGCGVWLITGQDPPDTNREVAPSETDAKLPHMTIFTNYGDLNLHQKLTVFKKFISWPEFNQCPFKVTMENNLPKFITASEDESKERSSTTHLDDDDESDHETDPTQL